MTSQMPLFEADRKHCLCWKISMGISSFVMKWQRSSELWPAPRSCSPESCPLLQLLLLPLICMQHMHCTQVFNVCATEISAICHKLSCMKIALLSINHYQNPQKLDPQRKCGMAALLLLYKMSLLRDMQASHAPSPKFSSRSRSGWTPKILLGPSPMVWTVQKLTKKHLATHPLKFRIHNFCRKVLQHGIELLKMCEPTLDVYCKELGVKEKIGKHKWAKKDFGIYSFK